jgi:uncharacterized membrane protein YjgN (DUF898 family)
MPDRNESIFVGALVTALLSTSYLGVINCFCCAGVIIGALVSVWHYTSSYDLTMPSGQGAVIGLAAAALGGVIAVILNYLLAQVGLGVNETVIRYALENYDLPSQSEEQLRQQLQQAQTLGAVLLNGLITVVVYGIFGAIGGAIGASIFKKGNGSESGSEGEWKRGGGV